jgi:HlyD family secretion protein
MKLQPTSRKKLLLILIAVTTLAAATLATLWTQRTTAEEFITAKIEQGNIRHSVSATGTLQAVTTVQVGSQVSGTIAALFADFNSTVRKGQVVAQLDPAIFQAQVASARANLEQAKANLADAQARVLAAEATVTNQRAGVSSATANLAALKAQRDDAHSLLQRQEALTSSGIITQRELDAARANSQAAEARHNQAAAQLNQAKATEESAAKAGIAQARAQVQQAKAQVQQTEAALRLAEVNLSHTTIASPIDGVVVSRNVDVGQTVAASLQAPTLFTIANDLTQMQVIANIDQADIGVINSSNRTNFTVDAFPGQNFTGAIRQIRLNPQNAQNVVTYNVVIDVDNPELKLKPGMTANLTVTIAERTNILKVPNAALRFIPRDVTPDKLREMIRGDQPTGAHAKPSAAPSGSETTQANDRGRRRQPDQTTGSRPGSSGNRPSGTGGPGREGGPPGSPTSAVLQGQTRIVWVLGPDGKPQPRKIKLGITDGVNTEMAEGELKEGDQVIVGQNRPTENRPTNSQRPPGFGGGPGGGFGGRPR